MKKMIFLKENFLNGVKENSVQLFFDSEESGIFSNGLKIAHLDRKTCQAFLDFFKENESSPNAHRWALEKVLGSGAPAILAMAEVQVYNLHSALSGAEAKIGGKI